MFDTRLGWAGEYPLYRRDEKGKPNYDECPLLACTGLLALSVPQIAILDQEEPDSSCVDGRSPVTEFESCAAPFVPPHSVFREIPLDFQRKKPRWGSGVF